MSIRHVVERALERYGLELTQEDCMSILVKVNKGQASPVTVVTDKRSQAWRVTVRGHDVVAVTMKRDDGRHVLRTIFPADSLRESGFKMSQVARRKA